MSLALPILLAATAPVLGGLISELAQRSNSPWIKLFGKALSRSSGGEHATAVVASPLEARLNEVRLAARGQRRRAAFHRAASALFSLGQYIVGGLLASSFVQEQLPPHIVGALGVVVLLSSLARQHLKPEAQALAALQRASQLRSLVRLVEDFQGTERQEQLDVPSDFEVLRMLSEGLDSVEKSETDDLHAEGLSGGKSLASQKAANRVRRKQ